MKPQQQHLSLSQMGVFTRALSAQLRVPVLCLWLPTVPHSICGGRQAAPTLGEGSVLPGHWEGAVCEATTSFISVQGQALVALSKQNAEEHLMFPKLPPLLWIKGEMK